MLPASRLAAVNVQRLAGYERRSREANSIASEPLAATSPPLVRAASADGLVLSALSTRTATYTHAYAESNWFLTLL